MLAYSVITATRTVPDGRGKGVKHQPPLSLTQVAIMIIISFIIIIIYISQYCNIFLLQSVIVFSVESIKL